MTDTSPSPAQLSPSPLPNFGHGHSVTEEVFATPTYMQRSQQQPIPAKVVRQSSVSSADKGKPSPYSSKVRTNQADKTRASSSCIGGPVKRRESMSGIGNNLRSNNPAGLGRAVGKMPVQQKIIGTEERQQQQDQGEQEQQQQRPSGLSNLFRRVSNRGQNVDAAPFRDPFADNPNQEISVPLSNAAAETVPMQRRGSASSSSTVAADTSRHVAGATVFPTNRGYAPRSYTEAPEAMSAQAFPRRATTISVRYTNRRDGTSRSPAAVATVRRLGSTAPQDSSGEPSGSQGNPLNVRVLHRSHSVSHRDKCASSWNPRSPLTPLTMGMSVGSPKAGDIMDIVGSPSKPSVIFAPVHHSSGIGGSVESKSLMHERVGLGGKQGKDWMADRPSNLGEPAPQNQHPGSGLTKIMRSLNISGKQDTPRSVEEAKK
ncbi:hypothetical protein LPJ57_005459 [Coemansia sp. RSA 486]|nr:hypothetical protein LPJ57_005459 [Coemansia sp. RSA 486]KAJ2227789.1 hypothetical protein IWW45_006878 [Coemansia sp. RSA 485]